MSKGIPLTQVAKTSLAIQDAINNALKIEKQAKNSFSENLLKNLLKNLSEKLNEKDPLNKYHEIILSYICSEGFSLKYITEDLNNALAEDNLGESAILDNLNTKEGGNISDSDLKAILEAIKLAVAATLEKIKEVFNSEDPSLFCKMLNKGLSKTKAKTQLLEQKYQQPINNSMALFYEKLRDCIRVELSAPSGLYEALVVVIKETFDEETFINDIFDDLDTFNLGENSNIIYGLQEKGYRFVKKDETSLKHMIVSLLHDVLNKEIERKANNEDCEYKENKAYKTFKNDLKSNAYPYLDLLKTFFTNEDEICARLFNEKTLVERVGTVHYEKGELIIKRPLFNYAATVFNYLSRDYMVSNPKGRKSGLRSPMRAGCLDHSNRIRDIDYEATHELFQDHAGIRWKRIYRHIANNIDYKEKLYCSTSYSSCGKRSNTITIKLLKKKGIVEIELDGSDRIKNNLNYKDYKEQLPMSRTLDILNPDPSDSHIGDYILWPIARQAVVDFRAMKNTILPRPLLQDENGITMKFFFSRDNNYSIDAKNDIYAIAIVGGTKILFKSYTDRENRPNERHTFFLKTSFGGDAVEVYEFLESSIYGSNDGSSEKNNREVIKILLIKNHYDCDNSSYMLQKHRKSNCETITQKKVETPAYGTIYDCKNKDIYIFSESRFIALEENIRNLKNKAEGYLLVEKFVKELDPSDDQVIVIKKYINGNNKQIPLGHLEGNLDGDKISLEGSVISKISFVENCIRTYEGIVTSPFMIRITEDFLGELRFTQEIKLTRTRNRWLRPFKFMEVGGNEGNAKNYMSSLVDDIKKYIADCEYIPERKKQLFKKYYLKPFNVRKKRGLVFHYNDGNDLYPIVGYK